MLVPPQFLYTLYEKRLLKELDPERMPRHVAIIMDGNRRYSKIQGNMEVIKGLKLLPLMPFQQKTSTGLRRKLKD